MSHLVTQAVPVAHSLGWPPARLAPGPHARGRGSSSGCGDWTASALDSPPCSPCGRPASSSTAGGAGCAGPGGTLARSSDTCVVFAWSSAGILQPPMMRTSTPDRDVGRRRAEEDEEALTGSFSKKTPPKKTAVSDRWNHYTFKPVLAPSRDHRQAPRRVQPRSGRRSGARPRRTRATLFASPSSILSLTPPRRPSGRTRALSEDVVDGAGIEPRSAGRSAPEGTSVSITNMGRSALRLSCPVREGDRLPLSCRVLARCARDPGSNGRNAGPAKRRSDRVRSAVRRRGGGTRIGRRNREDRKE